MKKAIALIVYLIVMVSCTTERYRTDRSNRQDSKAELADDFHAKQAIRFTQRNIERKDIVEKRTNRRKEKIQDQLNELNTPKKVKVARRHTGKFNLY